MSRVTGTSDQPVSNVQWVSADMLAANDWNPNIQAPPEHALLRISLLENGWTSPIVVREPDSKEQTMLEIVDGYHRWRLACTDPQVKAMTGGMVPIVRLGNCPPDVARMATIRHNRARGTHHVPKMAAIVDDLLGMGLTAEQIGVRLQMDPEEVDRLADHGQMTKRGAADGFGHGWTV